MPEHQYNPDRNEVLARLNGGKEQWFPFPYPFIYLMERESTSDTDLRRVPASFWKFLLILWHEIFFNRGPKKAHWSAEFYLENFHMRPSDAAKWSCAFENSRLFKIRRVPPRKIVKGFTEFVPKGPITVFQYNTQCTSTDWLGFYKGLMAACAEVNGQKWPGDKAWGAIVRDRVNWETEALILQEGGQRAPELA